MYSFIGILLIITCVCIIALCVVCGQCCQLTRKKQESPQHPSQENSTGEESPVQVTYTPSPLQGDAAADSSIIQLLPGESHQTQNGTNNEINQPSPGEHRNGTSGEIHKPSQSEHRNGRTGGARAYSNPGARTVNEEVEPDGGGYYTKCEMMEAWPNQEHFEFENHYNLFCETKGLALVLNNKEFPTHPDEVGRVRRGSEVDFANMVHLFKQLGYTVKTFQNLNKKEIKEAITNFSEQCDKMKMPDCKSAVITLMSHGSCGSISGTDMETVSLKWVEQQFYGSKCKGLAGKPKIFFFNACREGEGELQELDRDDTNPEECGDMYIANATMAGNQSMRSKVNGTWFVQSICEVFFARAHKDHLGDLMTKVNNTVSKKRGQSSSAGRGNIMQICDLKTSRMFKNVYFFPKFPPKKGFWPWERADR